VREATLGTIFVLAAAAGFGTIGIFGELAALVNLELATLLPIRFACATIIVSVLAVVRDWSLPSTHRDWLLTIMTLLFFFSLRSLTAGLATIVLYTYPIFVVVFSVALQTEAMTPQKLLALTTTILGVIIVIGIDNLGIDPSGVLLSLGAALCYAVYTMGSRSVVTQVTPRGLTLGVLIGTTVTMIGYGVIDGGLSLPREQIHWGVICGIVIFSTVLPHILFYQGVSRLEASRVGIVSTVEPVVTVILGVVLLNEALTIPIIIGGGFVLIGVILAQRPSSTSTPPSDRPNSH
jgi:drug/metabolite transporter (DMT)-like permease